jgi:hypothetical protein
MKFDWVTWSIWLLGFAILVIWIIVPIREFRQLLKNKALEESKKK